jgi:predicted phage tail protein
MRKVFLHGELGDSLGKEWDLEIDSVQEIFCAIDANTNKFTKFLADNSEKFKYYTFQVDDEYLKSKEELESNLPKNAKNIHIMPQVAGGDPVSILTAILVSVATGLIMQALFKPPKAKEQKETRSYLFGGTQNVAAQGIPVPLGYGRLRVGSAVVSAATRHFNYNRGSVETPLSEVQKNRGIRSLAGDFATFNSPVLYKNPNPASDTLDDVEYNTYLNVSDFRRLQFDIDIHDDEAPPPSFGE